jgi:hypothetical protein
MDQLELETSHSGDTKGLANSLLIRARFRRYSDFVSVGGNPSTSWLF